MLKNVTFSADDRILRKAREKAHKHKQSLNVVFRQWLMKYATGTTQALDYHALMKQLNHVKAGKHFSRDDLNER